MELSPAIKKDMFWDMLLARRLDERAWVLHRQGRIAFHISGIGHEAAQVGSAYAMRRGQDWLMPYYRDLAFMICLGYTPRDFMLSLMGKREEPTSGGRQMPSHWNIRKANVVSQSAPVATQTPHAAGIGLAIKLKKDDRVVITSNGEGSTSQGEWYEAVNWAAVHKLPVVFLVENNQYAISETPDKQMAVRSVADKACGLGLDGRTVDGTNVFLVYEMMAEVIEKARSGGGPSLVEAVLYRITPHSSDDDDRTYRSREEVEDHKKKDPILTAQAILQNEGILTAKNVEEMEAHIKELINEAVQYAEQAPYPAVEEGTYPVYAEEVHNG
jgi:2-oxoisovalerate dehydrogenase E1 component alpha subunit